MEPMVRRVAAPGGQASAPLCMPLTQASGGGLGGPWGPSPMQSAPGPQGSRLSPWPSQMPPDLSTYPHQLRDCRPVLCPRPHPVT